MINKNNEKQFSFQFVFIMILFLMIVILSSMIILLGKNIYSKVNEERALNYEKRVSIAYVANKIRQADRKNSVRTESLSGQSAVVISEIYDGYEFETWIYFYDGAIYEMFADKSIAFSPDDGMKVTDAESFNIEKLKDNLYKLSVSDKEKTTELILNLYSN